LPRKESSNFSRILREFKHFNWTRYFLIIFLLYQSGMREGWARDQRWKGMGRRGTEDWGGMNRDRRGTGEGHERERRRTGEGQERDKWGQERDRRGIARTGDGLAKDG
jgi:hypothetical protein